MASSGLAPCFDAGLRHKAEADAQLGTAWLGAPLRDGLKALEEKNTMTEQTEDAVTGDCLQRAASTLPAEQDAEDANLFLDVKDCLGRKYRFPWRDCKTWKQMAAVLNDVFRNIDSAQLRKSIRKGYYDLRAEEGFIAYPKLWQSIIKPGDKLLMCMWPLRLAPPPPRSIPLHLPPLLHGPVQLIESEKKINGKYWPPSAGPGTVNIEPEFTERIEVISRSRFEANDREVVDNWLARLPSGTERMLELDLPYEDEKASRDQYLFKWKVLLALCDVPPAQSLFYLMHIVDKASKLGSVSHLRRLDTLVVVLGVIRNHRETRCAIAEKGKEIHCPKIKDRILSKLYGRSLLDLAYKEFLSSKLGHFEYVANALTAFNIWNTLSTQCLSEPKPARKISTTRSDRNEAFENFKLDDLNIYNLQKKANIEIQWTSNLTMHLLLKTDDDDDSCCTYPEVSSGTLWVYWHNFENLTWLASLYMRQPEDEVNSHCRELRETWSILFQPDGLVSRRRAVKAYKALDVPDFITEYAPTKVNLSNIGTLLASPTHAKYCADSRAHLSKSFLDRSFFRARRFNPQDFPVYAKRLEILKEHLDETRPGLFGWRVLKRDKQHKPYVLWLVGGAVLFGVVSLLLALLILASSIVQAWASVKSMKGLGKTREWWEV